MTIPMEHDALCGCEMFWSKGYGTLGQTQPATWCESCTRTIRQGAWELIDKLSGHSYCRRCGWRRWTKAHEPAPDDGRSLEDLS